MKDASTVVALDFETTGLSPDEGDRGIDIGTRRLTEEQMSNATMRAQRKGDG
ncbi:hypothetical protein [Candidatus Sororendozoicomonas aggregata]|uniref:hypothetical protein n=1 Tax=Candidatus Sororendozoicomonas aggregata TaxID=3073239 RepID=UPI002ED25C55